MTGRPERHGRPQYTGISTYRDPLGRFEFKHATDWIADELTDEREGTIFLFEPGVLESYFAVWVSDLGERVQAEDLDVLRDGFTAGLEQLSGLQIEQARDDTIENLVKLERIFTFDEDGARRKRRIWAIYVDHWQIMLVFQAATVEEYAFWEPMGNYAFARFGLPPDLWSAVDRDLATFALDTSTSGDSDSSDADSQTNP